MSARGIGAFLALWNGVGDPSLLDEYEAWHTFEHVPERVGSPGFAWACRYAAPPAVTGQQAYFTLYGLASLGALQTPRYQALVDHPTDWSARMRGVLSEFRREPCEALSFHGVGDAGRLATLQVRVPSARALERVPRQLEVLVQAGRAVSACLGRVDHCSGHPLSAPAVAPSADSVDVVILLQHVRDEPLQAAVQVLQAALGADAALRAPVARYELQSVVRQRDLAHPPDSRQPPRPDLRQHFIAGDTHP